MYINAIKSFVKTKKKNLQCPTQRFQKGVIAHPLDQFNKKHCKKYAVVNHTLSQCGNKVNNVSIMSLSLTRGYLAD